MKFSRIRIFITVTVLSTAFVSSCKMESRMPVAGYAIYMSGSYQGHAPYFVMADSTLTFSSNEFNAENLKTGSLISLIWNYYSDTEGKKEKTVETTGYTLLPQATSFLSTRPDTLGTAPADVAYSGSYPIIWKMGGIHNAPLFLNLGFKYAAMSTSSGLHYVHLTYSTPEPDEDNYFHLKFSHEAGTDTVGTQQTSFAFKLPSEAYTPDVKGVILQFDGIGTDRRPKYYRYTYATGKVEEAVQE